jgi:hypothetical protein
MVYVRWNSNDFYGGAMNKATVKVMTKHAVVILASASLLSISYQAARAESGTFEAFTSGQGNNHQIERGSGETVTGGFFAGTFTVLKSSGEPFADGSSAPIDCVFLAKKSATAFDLESQCTIAYSSEDKLFGVFRRKSGDMAAGTGGEGKFELLGGAGKYTGIHGSCPYKTGYLAGNRVVANLQCQWQK